MLKNVNFLEGMGIIELKRIIYVVSVRLSLTEIGVFIMEAINLILFGFIVYTALIVVPSIWEELTTEG